MLRPDGVVVCKAREKHLRQRRARCIHQHISVRRRRPLRIHSRNKIQIPFLIWYSAGPGQEFAHSSRISGTRKVRVSDTGSVDLGDRGGTGRGLTLLAVCRISTSFSNAAMVTRFSCWPLKCSHSSCEAEEDFSNKLLFLFYLDDAYDLDTHQMQDDCRQLQAKVVKPMRVIVWTLDVAGQKRKELESIDDAFCPAAQAGNLRKLGQASHLSISL